MRSTEVKLATRHVCPCGFGLLKDEIPKGKLYNIGLCDILPVGMPCNGCGLVHHVHSVAVIENGRLVGRLPLELFLEFSDEEKEKRKTLWAQAIERRKAHSRHTSN
jgi:hypothetical protein